MRALLHSTALAPLCCLVSLSACDPEIEARLPPTGDPVGAPAGDSGAGGETGTPDDTGAVPASDCALVDVEPRTVEVGAPAEVTWSWRCDAPVAAQGAWTLPLADGAVAASAEADGVAVHLTATLPAGAVAVGLQDLGAPQRDGAPMAGLALWLRGHQPAMEVEAALRGSGWNAWAGSPAEALSFLADDFDGNGTLDLLSYAVLADGEVVQGAQEAGGTGVFRDRRGLAHVEAAGFSSGEALWFESDTDGVIALMGATEPGEVAHVRQSVFAGGDWAVTVLRVNHGFMGERVPDVLLAVEPEWYAPETLLMNLLGVVDRGAGPVGVYCEGTVCWEWSAIGAVTPASVVSGQGFVGAFVDGELSGLQPATSAPKYWALDASDEAAGLRLHVIDYDYHTENWGEVKAFDLPDPGFAVEAVAGGGQDLDGDGSWELLVELWGEGGWQAWLVRGADDKEDGREPLLLGAAEAGALWGSPAPAADGATVLVPSTFSANERALRSTRIVADAATLGAAERALVVVEEWSLDDVMADGAASASPAQSAVAGRIDLGSAAPCEAVSGAPLPACRRGLLPQGVASSGAEGSRSPLDPYRPGDHLLLASGEGQTRVAVSRGLHPDGVAPGPLLAAWDGGEARAGWDGGLRLRVGGEDLGPLCHGRVFAVEDDAGTGILGQRPADCAAGTWSAWSSDGASATLPAPAGVAGAPLTLLSAVAEADGARAAFWRAEDGQVWTGRLGSSSGVAQWQGGAAPWGEPADAALLGLGTLRPGAVWVAPAGETAWPPAPASGWTSGASLPGSEVEATVVAVVGGGERPCPWQVVARRGLGDEAQQAVLFDSDDPVCADLPVPLAALSADGAREALVSASADGRVVLTRLDGELAKHLDVEVEVGEDVGWERVQVSTGDLNGDGLHDLLLAGLAGSPARALLGDGLGGLLDAGPLADSEAGVNVSGLAPPTPGRPSPVRLDPGLPLLQRPLEPVRAP